jgi:hypothetical protein
MRHSVQMHSGGRQTGLKGRRVPHPFALYRRVRFFEFSFHAIQTVELKFPIHR